MKKVEKILDVGISLAVLVCLMALMHSITELKYGIPAFIVVMSYISLKIRQYSKWRK